MRACIILLFSFCLIACFDDEDQNSQDDVSTDLPNPIRYLALGDSYTFGTGISSQYNWPNQFVDSLAKYDYEIGDNDMIATGGWTTGNLLSNTTNVKESYYNVVSLQIGVNNQFRGLPFSIFESEFNELLNRAIGYAGDEGFVFVLSIPDYGVTPFGKSIKNSETVYTEINEYNTFIENSCRENNILYINVTDISRDLEDNNLALAVDNLHPSGYQYSLWVEEILSQLL